MKKILIFAAAVLCLAVSCKSEPAQPVKKDIGIQLYSVRKILNTAEKPYAENYKAVFKALADMGYTCVEPANYGNGKFYGRTPEEFRADVEEAGMRVISSHTNRQLTPEEYASKDFSAALDWWKEAVVAHKATGMEYIVIPSFKIPDNLVDLKFYCDYLNAVGKICKDAGLKLGYHNHHREFGTVEDQVIYDFMLQNTDPELVFFQMDVYWAVVGKASPVAYYKKYPGRFRLMHIKDWKEVGQSGMVGFDAIFKNFDAAGCEGIIVEMEASSYNDILRTSKESIDYLNAAAFVPASYTKK